MGHSSIQITVDTYGHLIPGADINWIDGLDRKTSPQQNATPAQLEVLPEEPESLQVIEEGGERGRNRTYNLLIKSQLLCQLSYAPTVGIWLVGRTKIIASSGRFPQGWRRPHRAVPHGIEGLLRRVCAARAFLQGHRPDPARHSICEK